MKSTLTQNKLVQPGGVTAERHVRFLLFVTLLVCYTYIFPRWAEWSQNSRLNLTLAIVDHRSLSIDPYFGNTGDYAHFEGHYYTDKAPGPSFTAVPVYAAVRPILRSAPAQTIIERLSHSPAFAGTLNEEGSGLLTEKIYYMAVLMIVTFAVIVIPSALLGVLLYSFLRRLSVGRAWAVIITLIYGLATSAFTYSAAFFSHQLAAFSLFAAFFIGFLVHRKELSPAWVLAAGFLLGISLISEYPTFLIALAVFIYIVVTIPVKRWILGLLAAGTPPVALMMAYNLAVFHTPLPVGYRYSELYTELHSIGLLSLTYPHPEALWGITFGSFRGLFYVSPVLLLALAGLVVWWRWRRFRFENLVCVWATLSFILFNASSAMWEGGYSVGPRYLVPMLPFLSVGLGPFVIRWGEKLWARILLGLLSLISLFIVWAETLGGQNYPDWTRVPLTHYSLPKLLAGDIARNWGMILGLRRWASLLPLLAFLVIALALLAYRIRLAARAATQPAEISPETGLMPE